MVLVGRLAVVVEYVVLVVAAVANSKPLLAGLAGSLDGRKL